MAVSAAQVVVSSSAVALNVDTGTVSGGRLVVKNTHATDALVLGDASVTAGAGFALAAGQTLDLKLSAGEQVYAIRGASADITAHVLRLGG
ncbi:hypothetical protein [Micromonospora sp. WMMD1082]|uniref:hypothetical protein n=1 Tax=Micromonospora sp. WMMD1082 TaxID=3016104 RepID=UPI0024175AEF|nr:hypothetical protein [Micromonospora sp. WMMD1082]MDG4796207.1 hypothetical protein [Micromonospora sp. WMMD1082]